MMLMLTSNHESLQGEVGCGWNVDLLAATAQEILFLPPSVHGSYAELARCAEEVQRPPQFLQNIIQSLLVYGLLQQTHHELEGMV